MHGALKIRHRTGPVGGWEESTGDLENSIRVTQKCATAYPSECK